MSSLRLSTKDAIIEAAFEILNADPSASLSDIAARAGVGRATLHRHFPSREDLVRALTLIAISEMDDAVDAATADAQTYSDACQRMFAALVPLGDRHGFLAAEPVSDDPHISAELDRQITAMRKMIEALKQEGMFANDVPSAWIGQAFDYLLYASWDSIKKGDCTHQQAIDLAWRTFTEGLQRNAS